MAEYVGEPGNVDRLAAQTDVSVAAEEGEVDCATDDPSAGSLDERGAVGEMRTALAVALGDV